MTNPYQYKGRINASFSLVFTVSVEDLIRSQHAQAGVDRGIYGENKEHTKQGDPVATRIDIRTFINKGEYVVTIHSDKKTGKVIGYTSSIWLESPEARSSQPPSNSACKLSKKP